MPITDPEKSRTYQREYKRLVRSGCQTCQTPSQTDVPAEYRLATAADVLAMVGEQAELVMNDGELGTVERARTIGYLASVLLKAIEVANLAGRLEALEAALKTRSTN